MSKLHLKDIRFDCFEAKTTTNKNQQKTASAVA